MLQAFKMMYGSGAPDNIVVARGQLYLISVLHHMTDVAAGFRACCVSWAIDLGKVSRASQASGSRRPGGVPGCAGSSLLRAGRRPFHSIAAARPAVQPVSAQPICQGFSAFQCAAVRSADDRVMFAPSSVLTAPAIRQAP